MPIPGVGFQEVVIIVIVALMIFGPAKLPELMGQAGKALRDFRKMTGNLQGEFEKNLNEVAGTDVRKTLSSEIANLKGEVASATASVNGKPAAKSTARPATTVAKPGASTAGKTATTTAAAKKTGSTAASIGTTGTSATKLPGGSAVVEPSPTDEIEFVPVRTTSRRGSAGAARPSPSPKPAPSAGATSPAPATATASASWTRSTPTAQSSAPDGDPTDPFARARSRRQTAGYQR